MKYTTDDIMNLKRFLPIFLRLLPIFIRLLPIFVAILSIFERLVPVFLSYFLERTLGALKNKGSIDDYRTRTIRINKFHYRIDIRIVLTSDQAKIILKRLGNLI